MLKNILACSLVLLCTASAALAQSDSLNGQKKQKPLTFKRHELSLGVGPIFNLRAGVYFYSVPFKLSLTYRYHLSQRVSVGAAVAYAQKLRARVDEQGRPLNKVGSIYRSATLAPEVTVNYIKENGGLGGLIWLYGSIGLGMTASTEGSPVSAYHDTYTQVAYQVSPFGMRVGRGLAGYLELGAGYKGIISGGITCRL